MGKAGTAGTTLPEEGLGETLELLPAPEGTREEPGRDFARTCRDSTRGNGFQLTKGRVQLDSEKKFLPGGGMVRRVERPWHRLPTANRGCPGNIQGQAGWGSEQLAFWYSNQVRQFLQVVSFSNSGAERIPKEGRKS